MTINEVLNPVFTPHLVITPYVTVCMTYLVEPPLQTALQDVVSRGAHVDVAVVPAWPLRVDATHPSRTLRQLTIEIRDENNVFHAKNSQNS